MDLAVEIWLLNDLVSPRIPLLQGSWIGMPYAYMGRDKIKNYLLSYLLTLVKNLLSYLLNFLPEGLYSKNHLLLFILMIILFDFFRIITNNSVLLFQVPSQWQFDDVPHLFSTFLISWQSALAWNAWNAITDLQNLQTSGKKINFDIETESFRCFWESFPWWIMALAFGNFENGS